MSRLSFRVRGSLMPTRDAAFLHGDQSPMEALAEAVVGTISTNVMVTVGDVEIFLAMLLDPDHWDDDWRERGIDDPDEFIAGLFEEA